MILFCDQCGLIPGMQDWLTLEKAINLIPTLTSEREKNYDHFLYNPTTNHNKNR